LLINYFGKRNTKAQSSDPSLHVILHFEVVGLSRKCGVTLDNIAEKKNVTQSIDGQTRATEAKGNKGRVEGINECTFIMGFTVSNLRVLYEMIG
jgi:hypothetical protein